MDEAGVIHKPLHFYIACYPTAEKKTPARVSFLWCGCEKYKRALVVLQDGFFLDGIVGMVDDIGGKVFDLFLIGVLADVLFGVEIDIIHHGHFDVEYADDLKHQLQMIALGKGVLHGGKVAE